MASSKKPVEAAVPTDLVKAVKEMQKLGHKLEDAKDKQAAIQKEYDRYRMEVVPNLMESMGFENMRISGVGRVSLSGDMRVNVLAANRSAVMQWLRDNGHGDLIGENINPSTMKAFVKELMQNGEEIPETITVHPFTKATITKS